MRKTQPSTSQHHSGTAPFAVYKTTAKISVHEKWHEETEGITSSLTLYECSISECVSVCCAAKAYHGAQCPTLSHGMTLLSWHMSESVGCMDANGPSGDLTLWNLRTICPHSQMVYKSLFVQIQSPYFQEIPKLIPMVAGFCAPFVGRTPAPELAVLQQHQRHLRSQISWKASEKCSIYVTNKKRD